MTAHPPEGQSSRRAGLLRPWHAAVVGLALAVVGAAVLVPDGSGDKAAAPRPAAAPSASTPASAGGTTTTTTPAPGSRPDVRPSARPGAPGVPGAQATGTVASGTPAAPPGAASRWDCAQGENAGATDRGVTATSVSTFTTVTRSGLAAAGLGQDPMPPLMGPFRRANQAGGVCGRQVEVRTADDAGNGAQGREQVRQAIADGAFAIPFAGAPDVLEALLDGGDLATTRTPLVTGTRHHAFYGRDWVWPVGVPDTTAARLMVREAHARGARTFGVVFADPAVGRAFDAEVRRLTGRHVAGYTAGGRECRERYCGAPWDSGSVKAFYADPPDFVGLLVGVVQALQWMQDPGTPAAGELDQGYAGLDPLLVYQFRSQCQAKCDGFRVWSAYKARCGAYERDPALRAYEQDLDGTSTDHTDPRNAATYAAAQLFLSALREAGPDLTRDRVAHALRTAPLRADLTVAGTVSFARGGNRTLRAYDLHHRGTPGPCTLGPVARG